MNLKNTLKALGPGLLWAGAAIGVSHLVQSTRAGATFGFEFVWVILLANLFKYPFFEFAPRYAASTGESLIDGYKRLGKWVVILYGVLTIATMFTLIAAVTSVTAGLVSNIFASSWNSLTMFTVVLLFTGAVIAFGKYSVIDKVVKVIIVLLAVSTIIAVISAFSGGFNPDPANSAHFDIASAADIALLLAVAGWMPTAIDISVWHSVWTLAKKEETGYAPKLKEALLDFNIGYIGTVVLAFGFLALGALVMYGTGEEFSGNGGEFAGQLISLFTKSIGNWAYWLIAIAALATMASTTLTCLDAYPRVLKPTTEAIFKKFKSDKKSKSLFWFWLIVVIVGSIGLKYFVENMRMLVDIATILAFLMAPVFGYMNYKVITGDNVPKEAQPKMWLKILSWAGLLVLTAFSLYFIYIKFYSEQ